MGRPTVRTLVGVCGLERAATFGALGLRDLLLDEASGRCGTNEERGMPVGLTLAIDL